LADRIRFAKGQPRLHTEKNHFRIQFERFQPMGQAATPQINPLLRRITKFPPQKTNFAINYEISGLMSLDKFSRNFMVGGHF